MNFFSVHMQTAPNVEIEENKKLRKTEEITINECIYMCYFIK